jgi:hypothetical protein
MSIWTDITKLCFPNKKNPKKRKGATVVFAIFILCTLFLVFVKVTSPKTSSKVIPQNDSSNNFLSAVFLVKSGKTKALNKLFEELFDIRRSTYPFWYYPKNCLFQHFSLFVPFLPATEDIPEKDVSLKGGGTFVFGSAAKVQVFSVGGHTKGDIAYYFTERELLFCGDSLFALGCVRMFEGTPAQF